MAACAVVLGAVCGALVHAALGEPRFVSAMRIEADRYGVQVDEDTADEAARLLAAKLA